MRGTGSDHWLIRCTLSLRFAHYQRHTNIYSVKRLATEKLHQSELRSLLSNNLDSALQACCIDYSSYVALYWSHLQDVCYSIASYTLGYRQSVHGDWFDENQSPCTLCITELLCS